MGLILSLRAAWLSLLIFASFTIADSIIPGSDLFVFSKAGSHNSYQLADTAGGIAPQIYVDPSDLPGVIRVANDLAADFGRVLEGGSLNATVTTTSWASVAAKAGKRPAIVLGTVGRSSLLDGLAKAAPSTMAPMLASVRGKWETYAYQVVDNPWPGQDAALVVAGSDLRGSVFGAYGISEQIGVSPWYWWADVPATPRTYIAVQTKANDTKAAVFGPPSVKFRGIFFNDEAPALTGWGHANFKQSQYGSAFVTEFYKHAFELILRLRGNYLWPAMWSSMFYLDDAQNGPTADLYGVFMGTSHHEPMARADKEQNRFLKGSWDWRSNKAGVQAFMREGATRSRNWSTIYTLGMRGSGDAASATLTSQLLEEAIHWQQATLVQELGRPLSDIPQQWVMYKEVPGYWQNGMNVSDDVTLLWSDDNRGNVRRVPIANETARRGGSGMYYHFDYVGDPRNYKWINTIQLQKTWEQLSLAYHRGVQNIWLANVGDLKGLELPTAHFMALAWDVPRFDEPPSTRQWLTEWCARQFGLTAATAGNASAIMTTYGMLVARRKYEDLSMSPFAFSTASYDEAQINYAAWVALAAQAQALYDDSKLIPDANKPAFFEIVLHPVLAGKAVFEIYTKAALSSKYAAEHRLSTNTLASDVQAAFATDKDLKKRYHALLGGKWNHFMDQTHLGYTSWQEPGQDSIPRATTLGSGSVSGGILGITVQGGASAYPAASSLTMGTITPYTPPDGQHWLDLFLRSTGTVDYRITPNASYVSVTKAQQTLSSANTDTRAFVAVDWAAAPSGHSTVSLAISTAGDSPVATVIVPIDKTAVPADFHGHVEAEMVVSIEAGHHFLGSTESAYETIPDYGRTHSGVRLPPLTPSQEPGKGPCLTYPFYTFSTAAAPALTVYLSPSENSNPTRPNRYAFSIDSLDTADISIVQPVPLANAGSEPSGWSSAVVAGAYVKTSKASSASLAPGRHTLRVWLLEPTMVLTKLVVDLGGLKASTLGPPESARV